MTGIEFESLYSTSEMHTLSLEVSLPVGWNTPKQPCNRRSKLGMYFGDPIAAAARAKREKQKRKTQREAQREEKRQRRERMHRQSDSGSDQATEFHSDDTYQRAESCVVARTAEKHRATPTKALRPQTAVTSKASIAHRQLSKADVSRSSHPGAPGSTGKRNHSIVSPAGVLKRKATDDTTRMVITDKRARAAGQPQTPTGSVPRGGKKPPHPTRSLPADHRRFARRLREATMGKMVDTQRIVSVFRELERYTPTKEDLEESILLVGIIVHFKKSASNQLLRFHCKRMYKFWKGIISGKPDAQLTPMPVRTKRSVAKPAVGRRGEGGGASGSGRRKDVGVVQRTPTTSRSAATGSPRSPAMTRRPTPTNPTTRPRPSTATGKTIPHKSAVLDTAPDTTPAAKSGPAGKTTPGKSSLFRDLQKGSALEFRHHWPMLQKRVGAALKATPPDIDKALLNLDKLAATTATPSSLQDAIAGGLVADLKAYRKHPDVRVATRCAQLFASYKALMARKFV